MIKNGKEMLTMAVFAICITAPLGAILIATLGKRWLAYDAEFDTTIEKDDADKDATIELVAASTEHKDEENANKSADVDINKVIPE
jgi:hypothetical protein